jgi:hypothetical protein
MATENIVLKRDELFDLVWTEPLTKLAKRFCISDVGLAKICRRLQIPRPELGHWVRVQNGWPVKAKPPLPPVHDPSLYQVAIEATQRPADELERKLDADPLIIKERLPENRIHVSATLSSPHPVIRATAERAKGRRPDKYGRISLQGKDSLDIHVTPASLPRALRVMNALIKALETRGMKVSAGNAPGFETRIYVRGEELAIGIYESAKQVPHVMTPDEKKEKEKYGRDPYEKYDYQPSGKLSLLVKKGYYPAALVKDTEKKSIEECLNDFIVRLMRIAEAEKAERLEWEQRRAEEEEEQRRRAEIERRKRKEKERYEQLLSQVDAWTRSNQIRLFVEAVKASAARESGSIESGSDLDRWIQWANQQSEPYATTSRKSEFLCYALSHHLLPIGVGRSISLREK